MNVGLYSTKICAEVIAKAQTTAMTYREYPDVTSCWGMIDLVQSSNFRISNGPEKGYLRGETFFDLVAASIRPYENIRKFKEIGDAVVVEGDFRSLLESFVLIVQSAKQLAFILGTELYPFAIRCGIDFGTAKQLSRSSLDYLGEPIDRLSRIMTVRSGRTNFLIGGDVIEPHRAIINEYKRLFTISSPIPLNMAGGKALTSQIFYHELTLDPTQENAFDDYFNPWRRTIGER